jgi:cellulose biosynthesis protein BcsQ
VPPLYIGAKGEFCFSGNEKKPAIDNILSLKYIYTLRKMQIMAKKIFVGNYKGGVGKTTTVFELGAGLAKNHNKKVLLIDLDPQCSLTSLCMETAKIPLNIKPEETLNYAFDLYGENIKETTRLQILEGSVKSKYTFIKDIIKPIPVHGQLSFIPTALDLKNSRINDLADRLSAVKNSIISIACLFSDIEEKSDPDYILVDCPPSSNIIIQGIFLYCDYYLIPTIGDEISINGVTDYITEIESTYLKFAYNNDIGGVLLKKYFGEKPKLTGILETIYKNRVGGATTNSPGNTFRNNDNLATLRNLDAAISEVLTDDSVLSKHPLYQYPNMKNIFKNLIRHLDNRSTPSNYGIPKTISNGEFHAEYSGITDIIDNIL